MSMNLRMAGGPDYVDGMSGLDGLVFVILGVVILAFLSVTVAKLRDRKDSQALVFAACVFIVSGVFAYAGYYVGVSQGNLGNSLNWTVSFVYIGKPMVMTCFALAGVALIVAFFLKPRPHPSV